MTLTEFLLARTADDETAERRWIDGRTLADREPVWVEIEPVEPTSRALAECDAKRRIVDLHGSTDPKWEGDCPWCGVQGPCPTMRALALPYADHPDYRQEWKP